MSIEVLSGERWHNAEVVDLKKLDSKQPQFSVKLEGSEKIKEEKLENVRPKLDAPHSYAPKIGDKVEVQVEDENFAGWLHGTVESLMGEFYSVQVAGRQKAQIVAKSDIRPVTDPNLRLDTRDMAKKTIGLKKDLVPWLQSEEGTKMLKQVQSKAKLLICRSDIGNKTTGVLLLGKSAAIARAEAMLDIHFKHQLAISSFHTRRENQLKNHQQSDDDPCVEFNMDSELMGLLIGKKGVRVKRVRDEHQVEVDVVENHGDCTVYIYGNKLSVLEAARDDLEIQSEKVALEGDQAGFLLRNKAEALEKMRTTADVIRVRYDQGTGNLEILGSKSGVETARHHLETHLYYYSMYKEMDEKLDTDAYNSFSKGPGKGKGKGKKGGGKDESGKGKGKGGKGKGK